MSRELGPSRAPRSWSRSLRRAGAAAVAGLASWLAPTAGLSAETVQLQVLGGLAGVNQYTKLEEPFWRDRLPELTDRRLAASIRPFDRSGLRGVEMLQLMRLGVVPFGTALVATVSGEEPELNAIDLPALNPDIATARANVGAYRGHLRQLLAERYNIELLGIYLYPAQVTFCSKPFASLSDLAGRRVRTSSVGQSEMMKALGAVPIMIPFNEVVPAISNGVADCAITGTMSGNEIGLSEVTTHIHPLAISWGISIFGANRDAWRALAPDLRTIVADGVAALEREIWDAADRETSNGLACDVGAPSCQSGRRSRMTLVGVTPAEEPRRRQLLVETVLPSWIQRCGDPCAVAWNQTLAGPTGITASSE